MTNFDLEEVKLIIKSIVISSKDPIAVNDLKRDYRQSEGRELPFTAMGYTNILDFLHSLKDTLVVLPNNMVRAVESADQQHLVKLIQRQRTSTKRRNRNKSRLPSKTSNYTQTQYNRQRSAHPRNQTGALSRVRYSGSNTNHSYDRQRQPCSDWLSYRNCAPERNVHLENFVFSPPSSSLRNSFEVVDGDTVIEDKYEIYNESVEPSVVLPEPQVSMTRIDYSAALTPQLKNNLLDIIREHPEGIRCSELSQLVREKYGVSLNYRKYGFSNMIQLVDSIPQIFKFEDEENKDWLLLDAQNASNVSPTNNIKSVSSKVCEKIFEVAKTLNYPMTTWHFDKRYENMNRKSLCEEVEGFNNIDLILMSIDKKFVRLEKIQGHYYVLPFKKWRPNALDVGSDEDEVTYPSHMLPLGGEVPPLEPFSDAISPTMKVKLGEIYNPHKFFMLSSYLKNSYDHLDKHIQLFYAQSDHLALTDLPVKKGLYCVAPYLDKWHRAVIIQVQNLANVIVFLIDFGTTLKLSKSELRFLHEDFASIPRLALRAALQDITPVGNIEKFSIEANRLFLQLTAEKDLTAYIKRVDFTQQKYLVQLAEKVGDSEVCITEKLVAAGLAEFKQTSNGHYESTSEPTSSLSIPTGGVLPRFEALNIKNQQEQVTEPNTIDTPFEPKTSTGALLKSLLSRCR